jgi:hypothetical protein
MRCALVDQSALVFASPSAAAAIVVGQYPACADETEGEPGLGSVVD